SRFGSAYTLSIKLYHLPPLTPLSRALSIRSVHTVGSTHLHLSRVSPACLASGTIAGFSSFVVSLTNPPPYAPSLHLRYEASSLLWTLCLLFARFFGLYPLSRLFA